MPNYNAPQSLFDLSVDVIVRLLTTEGTPGIKSTGLNVACVPYTIIDEIFGKLLSHLCKVRAKPCIQYLLPLFTTGNLTRVDLSPLCRRGRNASGYDRDDIQNFKISLISVTPSLKNLVYLSLETDVCPTSLPTCDDNVLSSVGKYCGMLRYLNVSNNRSVSDEGLKSLVPKPDNSGCPRLEQLILSGCSRVTHNSIADILYYIRSIRHIECKDIGTALMIVYEMIMNSSDRKRTLNLTSAKIFHNGLVKDLDESCSSLCLLSCMTKLCPNITSLQAFISDEDVYNLRHFPNVSNLYLCVHGLFMSHKRTSIYYFILQGSNLTSLSLVCTMFSTEYFEIIGENCHNLSELKVQCYMYYHDIPWECFDDDYQVFPTLSVFHFTVTLSETFYLPVPMDILTLFLKTSRQLRDITFVFRSDTLTDDSFEDLWNCIDSSEMRIVNITVPGSMMSRTNKLSLSSAYLILNTCPLLESLGDLSTWEIGEENIRNLRELLTMSNYNVELICTENENDID